MDVFKTFIELLRQTGNVTKGQNEINESRQVFVVILNVSFAPKSDYCVCLLHLPCSLQMEGTISQWVLRLEVSM